MLDLRSGWRVVPLHCQPKPTPWKGGTRRFSFRSWEFFSVVGTIFSKVSATYKMKKPFLCLCVLVCPFDFLHEFSKHTFNNWTKKLSWGSWTISIFHWNAPETWKNIWENPKRLKMFWWCPGNSSHHILLHNSRNRNAKLEIDTLSAPPRKILSLAHGIMQVISLDRLRIRWRQGYRSFPRASANVPSENPHHLLHISFGVTCRPLSTRQIDPRLLIR